MDSGSLSPAALRAGKSVQNVRLETRSGQRNRGAVLRRWGVPDQSSIFSEIFFSKHQASSVPSCPGHAGCWRSLAASPTGSPALSCAPPSTPAALGTSPGAVPLQEGLWGTPALGGEDEEDVGVHGGDVPGLAPAAPQSWGRAQWVHGGSTRQHHGRSGLRSGLPPSPPSLRSSARQGGTNLIFTRRKHDRILLQMKKLIPAVNLRSAAEGRAVSWRGRSRAWSPAPPRAPVPPLCAPVPPGQVCPCGTVPSTRGAAQHHKRGTGGFPKGGKHHGFPPRTARRSLGCSH